MNLKKKKALAAKALRVGKGRIFFHPKRLQDLSNALTKQDLIDLKNNGSILVKPIKGRKVLSSVKMRRRAGSIRKRVKKGKKRYILLTRKLRGHIAELRKQKKISEEQYAIIRKEIRASIFRSKSHLKEHLAQFKK